MNKTTIKTILNKTSRDYSSTVNGWVRTKRTSKEFSFLEINDGSTINNLQVIVDHTDNFLALLEQLTPGTSCSIAGTIQASPAQGQHVELKAENITIYGTASGADYPLQKKRHSFEYLREIAHLRPRTTTFGAINRIRNSMAMAIHNFFQDRDFLYVQTPIITSSDCEGAGELFRVTTLDPQTIHTSFEEDFFGTKTGLTVSGQLEGELLALALGNIYTFGPTFRAENSNTSRHLAEFWMVEPEMAFADLNDAIDTAEEMIRYLFNRTLEKNYDDMLFFDKRIEPGIIRKLEAIAQSEFTIITYTEAIEICTKSDKKFVYPLSWGTDLQSEHERYLTEEYIKGPVVVIDYPSSIKPFYMKVNDGGKTVRAMDVLLPGVGEIIGGSQREDRYDILQSRMTETGISTDDYWWYLDSRKYGSAPHSGFGLGFERIIQFITGMSNIRDVIPFPRTPKNARF